MRFGGLLLLSLVLLNIFKGKMESHFECICSTKTPLLSHNVFAVKNFTRLVKDRLDFVIQQCCSCREFGLVGEMRNLSCP